LDATQLESRLTELTNTLVTHAQLDDALKNHQSQLPQDILDGLRDAVTANVREGMESLIATRFADFTTQTNATLGQIDTKVSRAVADALPAITQSTLATVRPEIASVAQAAVSDAITASDRRMADAIAGVQASLQSGLKDVRAGLTAEVAAQLNVQLPAQLNSIRGDIAALKDQVGKFNTRLNTQEAGLATTSTRVEQVSRDDAAARADMQRGLVTEMSSRDAAVSTSFNSKFTDFTKANQDQIKASIAALQRSITDQIQRAATDAASAESRNLLTTLRSEMVTVAQDQVAAVQSSMQTLVTNAVADSMRAVPGIVSQQVRVATANMPDLVKSEFKAFQPQLKVLVQQEVSANPTIRGGVVSPRVVNP